VDAEVNLRLEEWLLDLVPILGQILTAEQYDAFPPDPRIELVDGILEGLAPPTAAHQVVVERLEAALHAVLPADLRIVQGHELRLADLHRRKPDLMVVAADSFDPARSSYLPEEVRVAIEVTDPTTKTSDGIHKPAEYAEAGITHYWRVATTPEVVVHTHLLDRQDTYRRTGAFTDGERVAAPGLEWADITVRQLSTADRQ
jgi:Uma2 family endonuclease